MTVGARGISAKSNKNAAVPCGFSIDAHRATLQQSVRLIQQGVLKANGHGHDKQSIVPLPDPNGFSHVLQVGLRVPKLETRRLRFLPWMGVGVIHS